MDSFLRTIVWFGAQQRYAAISTKVKHQLEEELALITKLGFPGYFLIVWDIVNFCREHNIMVQGRGSAANSAVCYCLGITPVDPVENHLVFERFLNESRKGWPDIDLDLPSGDRREAVIQEIYRRYGKHGAAMTANVISYRGAARLARSAKRSIFLRASSIVFPICLQVAISHTRSSSNRRSSRLVCRKTIRACRRSSDCIAQFMDCRGTSGSIPVA